MGEVLQFSLLTQPLNTCSDTSERLKAANCALVQVPPSQTHVFQPADQYIIKSIKDQARKVWDEWLSELFQENAITDAVKEMTATSHPLLRKRKVDMVLTAVQSPSQSAIVESWAVCGILRVMYGHVGRHPVLYDVYEEAALLEIDANATLPPLDDEDELQGVQTTVPVATKGAAKRGRPRKEVVAPPPKAKPATMLSSWIMPKKDTGK